MTGSSVTGSSVTGSSVTGSSPLLFTVGEVLAVFLPTDSRTIDSASAYRRTVAGSESNVAAATARLGNRARFVTAVGSDALGDAVENTLRECGIDVRAHRVPQPTGVIVRDLARGGPCQSVHLRSGSAATSIGPEMIDEAWTSDVAAVFVTGITAVRSASARLAVERTVQLARSNGALVIVDPNLRLTLGTAADFTRALDCVRGNADIAIGDLAELALMAGSTEDAAVAALVNQGCRIVVTKLGAAGAVATDGALTHHTPSRAISVVDTVGAGDAFAAGFIAATLDGAGIRAALEWASAVAAPVVGASGDIEGLPTRAQVQDTLKEAHR
ncbi:sugar kinase [Nakamurella antarctica]|uniref:sugar kinase n=1 Tax=Nakamurella antarctica TaxID=1902245 RepID=UPI0013DDB8FC|nr:sugar kinase [Nakamurella antarctica]